MRLMTINVFRTVQLWTMNNYHYYLKQELFTPTSSKRFTAVEWHPEQALTLYLTGEGEPSASLWDVKSAELMLYGAE